MTQTNVFPKMYRGEKTVVVYLNPYGTNTPNAALKDTPADASIFQDFIEGRNGRSLAQFDGVNEAFYQKALRFVGRLPKETKLEKVELSDIIDASS